MASCLASRRSLAAPIRASLVGACALLALACWAAAPMAASQPGADARSPEAALLAPPCRLAGFSLDRVPVLLTGDTTPELIFAQRALEGGLDADLDSAPNTVVAGAAGFRSPARAGAMSLALPGTGQLYAGSKRGFLFLGVEAVALLSYATFQAKSDEKRDEYYAFVGDPNDPSSRFAFDRLASTVSSDEMARLRTMYEHDPSQFYQAVTMQSQFSSGWQDPSERYSAETIAEDADRHSGRSRVSLYTLIANHLVSAADALNFARFSNITLRENMTLKLKMRPGGHRASYAFTVTQKF